MDTALSDEKILTIRTKSHLDYQTKVEIETEKEKIIKGIWCISPQPGKKLHDKEGRD